MPLVTFLDFIVEDAQGYRATHSYRIKPAAYGSTTLPTQAKIQAVADALFGDAVISGAILMSWEIRVKETGVAGGGGLGNTSISEAIRARSASETPAEFLVRIPGANKANLVFDAQNPNAVSTATAIWSDLRDALTDSEIAVSSPVGAYAALLDVDLFLNASAFDGRRASLRPR